MNKLLLSKCTDSIFFMIKKHWPLTDNYGHSYIFWQTEYKNQSQDRILIAVVKTLYVLAKQQPNLY